MKTQFLYLVQSRLDRLGDHKVLESENSDYIVATFEKKIEQENAIYIPNTTWEEGRNALYKEAMRKGGDYEYFVFLDDDIIFERGNFRLFEKEVLEAQPNFAAPVYTSNIFVSRYDKCHSFRYSNFVYFDSAFICISKKLFHSPKLLPYDLAFTKDPQFTRSFYASRFFWMCLFEYFSEEKLVVLNKIAVSNGNHDAIYTGRWSYLHLKKVIKKARPKYQDKIGQAMPAIRYYEFMEKLEFPLQTGHKPPKSKGLNLIYKGYRKIILTIAKPLIFVFMYFYVLPINFFRDLKLNQKLSKKASDC